MLFRSKVTLTSDTPGMTQLFWDTGEGMNEVDSSAQPLKVEPRPVQYGFLLPLGTIKSLRFDPTNRQAVMTFRNARIEDRYGHLVRSFQPDEFIAANQIARHEVRGDTLTMESVPNANDPVLDLKLATPLVLKAGLLLRLRDSLTTFALVLALGLVVGAPPTVRRLQLWCHPLVAGTLVALLGVFWVGRKRQGLV